ncbi:MAG: hypothetical protein Q8Q12_02720 [bacterium]|nr:hypothetical protein [bacterium]
MRAPIVVAGTVLGLCVVLAACRQKNGGDKERERLPGSLEEQREIGGQFGRPLVLGSDRETRFSVTFQEISLKNVPELTSVGEGDKDFVKILGKVKNLGPRRGYLPGHLCSKAEVKVDKGYVYRALVEYRPEELEPGDEGTVVLEAGIPQGTMPVELLGECPEGDVNFRVRLPKVERDKGPTKERIAGVYVGKTYIRGGQNALTLKRDGTFEHRISTPSLVTGDVVSSTAGTWEMDGRKIKFYPSDRRRPVEGKIVGRTLYYGLDPFEKKD